MDGAALSERSDLLRWQDLVCHMLFSPAAHLGHDGGERLSILRERILGLRRHDRVDLAMHELVALELAELLGEHLRGCLRDELLELAEAQRPVGCQVVEDDSLAFYPLMTSSYFGLGAFEGSVVEMVWSLGMLLAGVAIAKAKLNDEIRASYVAGALIGATCIGCGLVPASYDGWIAFSVLCAGMGAASTCYDVPIVAYLQKTVPQARQGRAFSAFQIVSLAVMPAGLAIASPVAEALGVNAWFGVSGVAILLLCLVMLVLERRLRTRL